MDYLRTILHSVFGGPASAEDLARARETAETHIKHPVAVFSKSYCPYCIDAKSLLKKLGANAQTVELDHVKDGSIIQQYLAQRANASRVTVPQIYIKGELIGGCSELKALHARGGLEPLLA